MPVLLLAGLLPGLAVNYDCNVAVIGAGPGGTYVASRLVEGGTVKNVCLFELTDRVGGRIHSIRDQGPKGDLVVETGGYRFAVNRTCASFGPTFRWCIETPTTKGVVTGLLKLKWKLYDPAPKDWDHKLAKIVDDEGHDRGFVTFVEELLRRAQEGAEVRSYFRHELIAIHQQDGKFRLEFANGQRAQAAHVVLNVPQHPLYRIFSRSTGLAATDGESPSVFQAVAPMPIMKLYVHYNDAWWRNTLGLVSGPFNNTAAWTDEDTLDPRAVDDCMGQRQFPVPLQGSYHDADVRCDGPSDAPCRGFLQAAYLPSLQAVRYFGQFRLQRNGDPVTHIDGSTGHGRRLLRDVHESLVELHREQLAAVGAVDRVLRAPPDSAVLSIWDQLVAGVEAGCHHYKDRARDGRGVPMNKVSVDSLTPFPKTAPNLHVVNEAFGQLECFAEGSLQMAENLVHRVFKVPAPSWIPADDYQKKVLFNETAEVPRAPMRGGDLVFTASGM